MKFHCLALLFAVFISSNAFPELWERIPNGNTVPHPCSTDEFWRGVGHDIPMGPGPISAFGRDFNMAGKIWTPSLCLKDSDGDGKTNGEELGDPLCTWTRFAVPAFTDRSQLSHPGVCEPIDSENCREANSFLLDVDECKDQMGARERHWCPDTEDPSVQTFDIRFDNVSIPNLDTVYYCQRFRFPDDQDYQVIAWEPLISNYELLRQLTIYHCADEEDETKLLNSEKNWKTPGFCGLTFPSCGEITFAWAFGQGRRCYRSDVGIPFGKNYFRTIILQNHYNNPSLRSRVIDSSGIRFYYTTKKRPVEITMLGIGQTDIKVPPNSEKAVFQSAFLGTDTKCSYEVLKGSHRFRMLSMLFLMHKIGTHAKLEVVKVDGRRQSLIDEYVVYDRPPMITWSDKEAPVLEPGDDLEITCTFDSRGPQHAKEYAFFGQDSNDEMCFAFIEIYPRANDRSAQSVYSIGDISWCFWFNSNEPLNTINDCDNVTRIVQKFKSLKQPDALATLCRSPVYPALNCTTECYEFLRDNELLKEPCLRGAVFRYLIAFKLTDHTEDTYYIQTHTNKCQSVSSISETVIGDTNFGPNCNFSWVIILVCFFIDVI